ncbi:hypothetical protein EV193_12134 [Herbihabitans rhizosphaerae]|uniref:Uncharacterized protein n=1 Tax=Herbihabitans rhizosphaerae TaxID=1872711 RepID=A0A4V2ER79_9PSEU|nr:hypothetical protein [Herbihabitans rhizosphaerae]RZS29491.1 hypothetical protein EV193_12134 [Herbihabitans rhizosphaerae]
MTTTRTDRRWLATALFTVPLVGAYLLDLLAVTGLDDPLRNLGLDVVRSGDPLSLLTAVAMLGSALAAVRRPNAAPYIAVGTMLASSIFLLATNARPTGVGSVPLMATELMACALLLIHCLWRLDSPTQAWGAVAAIAGGGLVAVGIRFGVTMPAILGEWTEHLVYALALLLVTLTVAAGAGFLLRRRTGSAA